ncbi:MAG: radical SAM protein [Deltaproteobacteria bacterium]|nr:radical SAM protein [Deltaproteobacteria bacterium]
MATTRTIEWQVAGACNYDCSYCIQSRRYRRGRPRHDQLERAIAAFAALPGRWEIKCSGGEAFAHPLFLGYIVPELMARTPHAISVLTNFSASRAELMQFAQLTRGRLAVVSASLHLEFTTVDELAAKAEWFTLQLDPDVRFVVNQVVLPGREAEAERCRAAIEARGLRWFPQLYKRDGGVADYPDPDALIPLIGRRPTPREANIAPSYRGRMCRSGVDYFIIDKDGDAWACRTGKRTGEGALGNVFAGTLARLAAPAPCAYDICPCTVPANRGMIEGIAATTEDLGE